MNRVNIFIDGANFYHLVLRKLGITELDFNFERFANFLAGERIISPMGKRFYIGSVREKEGDLKSKEAMAKQTKLFHNLKSTNWEIKTSKLVTRQEEITIDEKVVNYKKLLELGISKIKIERLREKGIDVKLATDLIVGAVDDQYDTAIVISSDSDLIPAIDWIRFRKKKLVEYVGFSLPDTTDTTKSTNPLISLIARTDIKRILVKTDITNFVLKK